MSKFTQSGARRTGDEYQDLHSAEVLVEWLEHPESYQWVRLETRDGFLDDIQAERADRTLRLLQVKFRVDPSNVWTWDDLLAQEKTKTGSKPSLLQKWMQSVLTKETDLTISDAALLTNCDASPEIRACMSSGFIIFDQIPAETQLLVASQLGDDSAASAFFSRFRFAFGERSPEALEEGLRIRFERLGGTSEGWNGLLQRTRRWINRTDEPTPDRKILLTDVRAAALWRLPPAIPQDFHIPNDYVPPVAWSASLVEPELQTKGGRLLVITGSPGSGKSTYVSWLVDKSKAAGVPVVRHHYFLSLADDTARRTAWETAAMAIIDQFRQEYPKLVQDVANQNLRPDMLNKFVASAGLARQGKPPVVVIVDGLDHVWREQGRSDDLRLLFDMLLPVPDGVVVIVGTQDVELRQIPSRILNHCPHERWLRVPVLDLDGVREWVHHHEGDFDLPTDPHQVDGVVYELSTAFNSISCGHPLILHYTLEATRQFGRCPRADQILGLPGFDPSSSMAAYYQSLWDSISPEGHQLLHLLAGFPWPWPSDGLLQCIRPHGDYARFEAAEASIRHVTGVLRQGVTAFHESLLAFVRTQPNHEMASKALRPAVIDWLQRSAPDYWRWRYEWEELARNGEKAPLIESATLDWAVDSLVQEGRCLSDITTIVSGSAWAALEAGKLGTTTERRLLSERLEEAGHQGDALQRLLWLAMMRRPARQREQELNLLLSHPGRLSDEEIATVAEIAFRSGTNDVCRALLDEGASRWNSHARPYDDPDHDRILGKVIPSLIATCLMSPADGPYQRYVAESGEDPEWCARERYISAVARLCSLGADTSTCRDELRFLANRDYTSRFSAADHVVRLAWREGFDPLRWLDHPSARGSGLFRCDARWVRHTPISDYSVPDELSFALPDTIRFSLDQSIFVELSRSYFFQCMANAVDGRKAPKVVGLDAKATVVRHFLSLLQNIGKEAAGEQEAGRATGGEWFLGRLASEPIPKVAPNDIHNDLARPRIVSQVVVAVAQDLEEFLTAQTGGSSLTRTAVLKSIDLGWTQEWAWINDRVDRRLKMSDPGAADALIEREKQRLLSSRDYLQERAEAYATLAQFCHIHEGSDADVLAVASLAARNLLGHGFHKDMVLFDALAAIQACSSDKEQAVEWLRAISPVVQVVEDITDGDETRYLKRDLAEALLEVAPDYLPSYISALEANEQHWDVESFYTSYSRSGPLSSQFEKALGATLVHEDALTALLERTNKGDADAASVLKGTLAYCGRSAVADGERQSRGSPDRHVDSIAVPMVEDYPPERLNDYIEASSEARLYGEEHLAAWSSYWLAAAPERLLIALSDYLKREGRPLETRNAESVVALVLEKSGHEPAWRWMLAFHEAAFGWLQYFTRVEDVEWIWDLVRRFFPDRWLSFVLETSKPKWRAAGSSPLLSAERLVRYLQAVGRVEFSRDLVDGVVAFSALVAADVQLPPHSLENEDPGLPVALRLLVGRLDSPSRMVQERAGWFLAELLAGEDAEAATATEAALLNWHSKQRYELRSCLLLLIIGLAHRRHGLPSRACISLADRANIVPSLAATRLLGEFGSEGQELAKKLGRNTIVLTTSEPSAEARDFINLVREHLTPIFMRWANRLDSMVTFTSEWAKQSALLAHDLGVPLGMDTHRNSYYRASRGSAMLPISDQTSVVLRSSFLRTLETLECARLLPDDETTLNALKAGVMIDPALWAIDSGNCPEWWPQDPGIHDGLDQIGEAVGYALKTKLEDQSATDIIVFAAGPVGFRDDSRAELTVRAFLQSARGPLHPSHNELASIPYISCRPTTPRVSLPGEYQPLDDESSARTEKDWLLAPLSWWLRPASELWLLPGLQARGIHLPATWLFKGVPQVQAASREIVVSAGDQPVARYTWWHDELRERIEPWNSAGSGTRVGGQLLLRRDCVGPHLRDGATLFWVATLSTVQHAPYSDRRQDPVAVGTWTFGGSPIVRPSPWSPPAI